VLVLFICNFKARRYLLLCPFGRHMLTHASIALPYLKIDVMPRERVYLTCLFNLDSVVREEYRSERWIDALGEKQS
jgi:hypothetical protein